MRRIIDWLRWLSQRVANLAHALAPLWPILWQRAKLAWQASKPALRISWRWFRGIRWWIKAGLAILAFVVLTTAFGSSSESDFSGLAVVGMVLGGVSLLILLLGGAYYYISTRSATPGATMPKIRIGRGGAIGIMAIFGAYVTIMLSQHGLPNVLLGWLFPAACIFAYLFSKDGRGWFVATVAFIGCVLNFGYAHALAKNNWNAEQMVAVWLTPPPPPPAPEKPYIPLSGIQTMDAVARAATASKAVVADNCGLPRGELTLEAEQRFEVFGCSIGWEFVPRNPDGTRSLGTVVLQNNVAIDLDGDTYVDCQQNQNQDICRFAVKRFVAAPGNKMTVNYKVCPLGTLETYRPPGAARGIPRCKPAQ